MPYSLEDIEHAIIQIDVLLAGNQLQIIPAYSTDLL